MKPLYAVVSCALVLVGIASACGDDDGNGGPVDPGTTDAGGTDAGAAVDSGHSGHDSGRVDAGPPPIRCTDEELAANDKTDGGLLEITFLTAANPKQYENNCATVKVGATVTFSGSFKQHPLQAAGGDSPNPIPYTADDQPGNELEVVMTAPGTFGYECEFHPIQMFGAIRVVP